MKWRAVVRYVLIALLLIVPWLEWGDRPAILLDIANRKFYFPGFVIWPQEFYFLMLLLLTLGLSLFLFTALFGRIWCGWACPQTVYVELFDTIGRFLFPSKFGKRSETIGHKLVTHSVWILLSFVLTFHFIAYFVGARAMLSELWSMGGAVFSEQSWPYFLVAMSLVFYLDMGIFREQMCVYACPYARFQSVMLDRDSIVISYDSHRGEPRRGSVTSASSGEEAKAPDNEGDCTNCNLCVQVCPTGIDIREGLQVACINCGHCIDACTKEMGRFDKKTLISFSSLNFSEERIKTSFWRKRTVVYTMLLSGVILALATLFAIRIPIHLWVIPDPALRAVALQDRTIQNYYKLDISNISEQPRVFHLDVKVKSPDSALDSVELVGRKEEFPVKANDISQNRLLIRGKLKEGVTPTKRLYRLQFVVYDREDPSHTVTKEAIFSVPEL